MVCQQRMFLASFNGSFSRCSLRPPRLAPSIGRIINGVDNGMPAIWCKIGCIECGGEGRTYSRTDCYSYHVACVACCSVCWTALWAVVRCWPVALKWNWWCARLLAPPDNGPYNALSLSPVRVPFVLADALKDWLSVAKGAQSSLALWAATAGQIQFSLRSRWRWRWRCQ